MDLGQASNYFSTLTLTGWDSTLAGDPWTTVGMPLGRLLTSDREQTYGVAVRWRTLLTPWAIPAKYKAVRINDKVFILGQPDQDFDTVSYSYAYPVYRADSYVKLYRIETSQTVGATLAGSAQRTLVNTYQDYPCGMDRSGSVQTFDAAVTEMLMVLPDVTTLTSQYEIEAGGYLYQVKEAYPANGFQVVKSLRRMKVPS